MPTATEIMQREMEYINRYKNIINPYDLHNKTSMLSVSNSVQNLLQTDSFRLIQDTIRAQDLLKITDYNFGGSLASLQIGSTTQRALESINLQNIVKDSLALHKINQPDFFVNIQRQLESSISSSFQTVLSNIKESISVTAAEALRRFDEVQKSNIAQNIAQQTASSLLGLNSIQEAIGFRVSAIQQAMQTMQHMKIFADTESITKMIGQMQLSGVLEKSMSVLNNEHLFAQAIGTFNSTSYLKDFEENISEDDLSESLSIIKNANKDSFLDSFSKLNPQAQAIIIAIFLHFILPMVISIYSNLITPSVERALKSGKMNTEQVRSVKYALLPDIDTSNLRFITRNGEKLRANPSTRSEVLDELVIGQVFQVIKKKKGWAEIVYFCEDEQLCRGWILTTYTVKFKHKTKQRAIQETLHLTSIPGMRESIKKGLNTPVEKCSKDLTW